MRQMGDLAWADRTPFPASCLGRRVGLLIESGRLNGRTGARQGLRRRLARVRRHALASQFVRY